MFEFDLNKPYCYWFNEIAKIPHGSYNEKALSDFLVEFAKKRNLKYVQDEHYNVVMYKDASVGYENAEPLLLQAHMDMVCEKNKSSNHNFETDPLQLEVIDEEWLSAKGTTLGADDGTGVVYMLSILDDDSLDHPALECCFTVSEEVGLVGAQNLDLSLIKARRMVSLDGGGEHVTSTSSSGGAEVHAILKTEYVDNNDPTYSLNITGLLGGHSGGEIHNEKGNSIKTAFRVLKQLARAGVKLNVVSVEGGLKRNAIPRECEVVFTTTADKDTVNSLVAKAYKEIKTELEFSDPGVKIEVCETETASKKLDDKTSDNLVNYIFLIPNGFRHKSLALNGLTVASLNLGVINTYEDKIVMRTLIRSNIASFTDHMLDTMYTLAEMFNVEVVLENRYSGWNYKADSKLRGLLNDVLIKCGNEPLVAQASHGGLECGIFAGISEDMDIVTYGPIQKDIHTPDERLNLPSFDRAYKVLTELVKECK